MKNLTRTLSALMFVSFLTGCMTANDKIVYEEFRTDLDRYAEKNKQPNENNAVSPSSKKQATAALK